jgi:hypothetical protein
MGIRLKSGAVPAAVILSPQGGYITNTTVEDKPNGKV